MACCNDKPFFVLISLLIFHLFIITFIMLKNCSLDFRIFNFFETIPLSYLEDNAQLLNRKEIKFIIPIGLLNSILNDCKNEYYLLKINDISIFRYRTSYYDTADLKLYFDHHNGKGNRFKIREREYTQMDQKYVEIKTKNNKNQTIKYRKKIENWHEAKEFLYDHTNLIESDLYQSLCSDYTRITLLHKEKKEKVTLDFNLSFFEKQKTINYNNIVIVEVKTDKISTIYFNSIIKKYKIRSGSLSKYCLGMISMNQNIKKNNFKMIFNQIVNANNNGE